MLWTRERVGSLKGGQNIMPYESQVGCGYSWMITQSLITVVLGSRTLVF